MLRSNIMDVAREQEFTVKEKEFTLTEVYSASEVFITSASSGVVPVVEVQPLPPPRPAPFVSTTRCNISPYDRSVTAYSCSVR